MTIWFIRLAVLAALIGSGWYVKAAFTERDELRIEVAAKEAELASAARVQTTTAFVLSSRSQSAAAIQSRNKDVQVQIEKRIPAALELPGAWRVLHDAAAANEVPPAPGGADAQAISAKEAASTVASNYASCHDDSDRFDKLQQWLEGVSK